MRHQKLPVLAVIIPVYNGEAFIETTAELVIKEIRKLKQKRKISNESFILFIDDASPDNSSKVLRRLQKNSAEIKIAKAKKNLGEETAYLIGNFIAYKLGADLYINIDQDLQDPIKEMHRMVDLSAEYDLVAVGRKNRAQVEGRLKACLAEIQYIIFSIFRVNTVSGHSSFRLCNKRIIKKLISSKISKKLCLRCELDKLRRIKKYTYRAEAQKSLSSVNNYSILKRTAIAISTIIVYSRVVDVAIILSIIIGTALHQCWFVILPLTAGASKVFFQRTLRIEKLLVDILPSLKGKDPG